MKRILVTGGAGFIGSAFVRRLLSKPHSGAEDNVVWNLDKLTYAGHPESIPHPPDQRYQLIQGGVEDSNLVAATLKALQPQIIVHFAAESHVDRSIDRPLDFVQTNVVGTAVMLQQSWAYYQGLSPSQRNAFRFVHISTDEVYGSIPVGLSSNEESPFRPSSPYAASKAAGDLLVRSYQQTFGLPCLIVHCCNNYGPYQLPEKLIPLMVLRAAARLPLPIYGDGSAVRDWIHVDDTCTVLLKLISQGHSGQVYDLSADNGISNLDLVIRICQWVDRTLNRSDTQSLITFTKDRPGHDQRYAGDSTRLQTLLNWKPSIDFETGLKQTVQWYLNPNPWLDRVSRCKTLLQRQGH